MWGGTPPEHLPRTPYTFWNGTEIPGGVNPLLVAAVAHLDAIFERHQYRPDPKSTWCYNRRQTKHGRTWSLHSWAIAIDVSALANPFSRRFRTDFTPQIIADVQALTHPDTGARVWQWGGTWQPTHDTMHFQASIGPDEARSLPGPKASSATGGTGSAAADAAEQALAGRVTEVEEKLEGRLAVMEAQIVNMGERVDDVLAQLAGLPQVEGAEADELTHRRVELLSAVIGGAPYETLADWMLASLLGRDPTREEITELADRFAGGESAEDVFAELRERGGR